jgi:tetratricopeptide (TPR) repeat protein
MLAWRTGLFLSRLTAFAAMAACLVAGQGQLARAQTGMSGHAMGTLDETPPDKYPVPQKLSGIGNVHIKITATPEAQMWFDQGINLFHDFWDYESVRAFEQGVRVDPRCAMCYWGLYQAETFRRSSTKHFADEALAKAVSLKGHASKAERLYIEASAAHEAEEKNKKDDDEGGESKEAQILRKLVKHSSKDTQARIFLAEALMEGYDDAGEPKKGQKEGLAILQSVLKDEPENSAANHYWIHAVEASPKPEQALHSAEMLARLAPTSGHMVHMPGHIFYRLGDYARAQQAFAASTEADERYMQAQHVQVDDDWNYVHNLMYAIANLMEEGRLAEATGLSVKLKGARGKLEASLYPWSPRDGMARLDPRLPVALRTADWAQALELLKASEPPAELPNLVFLARQLTDFAAGMQALEAHDLARAEEASTRLDAQLWRISQRLKDEEAAKDKEKKKEDENEPKLKVMPDAWPKPLVNNLSIMSLELRAGILVSKKQTEEAKKLFAQAAQEEKDLGYHEPPAYIRPVRETEASALLEASAWLDAKAAFEKALVERPKSGFSLYGIARSSEQAGEVKAAATEYAEFVAAWKNADAGLPQLAHARAYLAEHGSAVAAAGNPSQKGSRQ